MKRLLLSTSALCFIFILNATNASLNLSAGYNSLVPISEMRTTLKSAHGLNFGLDYKLKYTPISVGLDFGISSYGSKKEPFLIQLSENGSRVNTTISIDNMVNHAILNGRFYFNRVDKIFNPYINTGFGMIGFRTSLTIDDPTVPATENCPKPLERDVLNRSRTWAFRNGIGVQTDLSGVFKKLEKGVLFFDLNIHHLIGGNVQYVGHLDGDIATAYQSGNFFSNNNGSSSTNSSPRGSIGAVKTEFQEGQGQIQEQAVGQLFENRLNMIGIQAKLIFRF